MMIALAVLVGTTTACSFSSGSDDSGRETSCDGLTGQARMDCETQKAAAGH